MSRPTCILSPNVMFCVPVGAGLDLSTGEYLVGTHDQRVLLGGVSLITGVVGGGNTFKTTLIRFMEYSLIDRLYPTAKDDLYFNPFDTEINTHSQRLINLYRYYNNLRNKDLVSEGLLAPTNKNMYSGNTHWDKVKTETRDRMKDRRKTLYDTAFLERDGVTPFKTVCPWVYDYDSLTHFITADVEKTMEETELGDSEANAMFLRQNLVKARMLMEMPSVAGSGGAFFFFTAHIGEQNQIGGRPNQAPPRKQLTGLRQNEKIKGVSNNFFYLLHNCWLVEKVEPAWTKDKTPEYPYEPGDETVGDQDLQLLKLKQLRGKNGGSNFFVEVYVSQREGLLPYLSDFAFIKNNGRFGLVGDQQNYALALVPDVKISRTKVRQKLRESHALQRAVEILAQMGQLAIYHPTLKKYFINPEALYTNLIERGYSWDFLLNETRSYHTLNDEEAPGFPLSTLDLLRIAHGDYHPYWLEKDCKTLVPMYAKKKIGPLYHE